jgi:hypothetical protein
MNEARSAVIACMACTRVPREPGNVMFEAFARVAGWDQLERVWEFVVGFFKFLWALLRFIGGG